MTLPALTTPISRADMQALEAAVAALERTSFARRISQLAVRQIGFAGQAMPEKWRRASAVAARRALEAALRFAIGSLKNGGRTCRTASSRGFAARWAAPSAARRWRWSCRSRPR